MIDILLAFPGFILEYLISYIIIMTFTEIKLKSQRHPIIMLFISCSVGLFIAILFPPIPALLLTLLLFIYTFKFVFILSFFQSTILYIISCTAITLGENLLISLLPASAKAVNSPYVQIAGCSILLIFFATACHILPISKLYNPIINGHIIYKLIIISLFIITFFDVIWSKLDTISNLYALPIIIACICSILLLFSLIIHQDNKIKAKQNELENYAKYQPLFEALVDNSLKRQHDFNNELQAIKALAFTHKDFDSLKDALVNYSAHISYEFHDIELMKINMKILAGFLYSKIIEAKEKNKTLNIQICTYNLVSVMPEYELVKIAGILLDNAIEATPYEGTLSITLDCKENRTIIQTINPGPTITEELQANIFKKGYSTKQLRYGERHGYGLNTLLELLNEYNGEVLLDNVEFRNTTHVLFEVTV